MPKSTRIVPALAALCLLTCGPLLATAARLDSRVAPVFQAIELRLDASQTDYSGSVRFDLVVAEAVDSFTLHSEGQELTRLSLRSGDEEIAATWELGGEAILEVEPARRLAPGSYELEIDFTHDFNTRAVGLYRMEQEGTGTGYLFTQFEAVDARKAFPCWDEPIYKIPFQMTLVVPNEHVAVSNTPIESETQLDGWRRVVFSRTKPMPSYLLAIASGPFESMEIDGLSIPGRIYAVAGQIGLAQRAAEITPTILAALEEWFGSPYPYRKLDFIAIPDYWFGAMENVGAVTFQDTLLLQDPETASVAQRRGQAGVIAHELAHMWFGDLVTMEWWDDLWLNESFASWMGDKVTDQLFPEYKLSLVNRRRIQGLMSADARPSTKPIRRKVESSAQIFEDLGLAYGKGQTLLSMVEKWIGEEVFRRGVNRYIADHAWGNAEAVDLWKALSRSAGSDLSPVLESFLEQPGLPLVSFSVDETGVASVRQQRFLNDGVAAADQAWTMPVRFRYSDGDKVHKHGAHEVDLGGRPVWIVPDDGAWGYYRWSLPRQYLIPLARDAGEILDGPERVAFLGNAAALLDAGELSGGDFLDILHAFSADPEPEVVSAVLSGLEKVETAFVAGEVEELFPAYITRTLRPVAERFGLERRPGESEAVSLFRPRLFTWLGDVGRDPEVRRQAATLAREYMSDTQAVDPAMAGSVLAVAGIEADRELFDAFRLRFERATVPADRGRYLGAMARAADADLQKAALDYSMTGPLRPNEMFDIPRAISRTEKGADLAYRWMTTNYGAIAAKVPEFVLTFMPFMASGCSLERLATAREFFADPVHQVDGTVANLAKVGDQVQDCARLRARESEAVLTYLKGLPQVENVRTRPQG